MEPKRRRRSEPPKRQHNVMSLSEKIKILDKLKYMRPSTVAKEYGVNESTIRYIQKSEDRIRASVNAGAPSTAVVSFVSRRDSTIERMEKLLWVWIEEQTRKDVPLCGLLIRSEALNLYETLKASSKCNYEENSSAGFVASRGWLDNFKKRFSLKNNQVGKSGSDDQTPTTEFQDEFMKYINDRCYLPEQVFNVEETKLFWKRLPSRTYISRLEHKERGLKASKDRLMILLCGNASGDFKSKPMLIYRTDNPFALKGKNKSQLPVFWRSNKIAWVTAELFQDWFENCFLVQVEDYLKEKKLPFKVLLMLDNAVRHQVSLVRNHPNIEIILLPPETSSLLPMHQGIILSFLSSYTRRMFNYILENSNENSSKTVCECWNSYNIRAALTIIKDSWDEVDQSIMNTSWHKIWPGVVHNFSEFPCTRNQVEKIIQLARNIGGKGFDDLKIEEVDELIRYHQKRLTNDEIVELLPSDEDDDDNIIDLENPTATSNDLSEIIKIANQLKEKVMEVDPSMERSIKFRRGIDNMVAPYVEMYKTLIMEEEQLQIMENLKSSPSSSTTE